MQAGPLGVNLRIITCLVVCVCGRVGVGVCVRVYMSASAVVYVSSNVSYAQRIRPVHKLFTTIHKWTRSCCALFVLYGWNVIKTNSSARFFLSLRNTCPCILTYQICLLKYQIRK